MRLNLQQFATVLMAPIRLLGWFNACDVRGCDVRGCARLPCCLASFRSSRKLQQQQIAALAGLQCQHALGSEAEAVTMLQGQ